MSVGKLDVQLKNGEASVYLLHGDAPLLTRRAADWLLAEEVTVNADWLRPRVTGGVAEDFNIDRFDAKDKFNVDRLVDAARTLPMMAPRRLVWVRSAEALFTGTAATIATLLTYLEQPDPSTCLLLHANDTVDRRSKLYKTLEKKAVVVEFKTPADRELAPFIVAHVKEKGRTIASDAAHYLADSIGRDLGLLDTTIERLTLFVAAPATITTEDVRACVPHLRAHTVWELTDAVADRNAAAALSHAHDLMAQGEPALRILALIADRIRKLLIGKAARSSGANPQEMAVAAGMPPFKAQVFARQVQGFQGHELLAAMDRLAEADRQFKRSKLDDVRLLEALLLDLCAPPTSEER